MAVPVALAFTGDQYDCLRSFLFPGDNNEAVALLLCGRRDGDTRYRLTVREVCEIPYDQCTARTATRVTWSPDYVDDILERAAAERLSVVKIHSHPNGYAAFSCTDDIADAALFPMIQGWIEGDLMHGSAVMLPEGEIFGRVFRAGKFEPIDCVSVAGDDLKFWYDAKPTTEIPSFAASHAQAFDVGTIERLRRLSIAVVGASGTGSPTIEQLVRLGVGEIVIVDDDIIEDRNINRIINSKMDDAVHRRPKVKVLKDAIDRMGLGTAVVDMEANLWDPVVVRRVAQCDIIFGCMDTVDGRYLLNLISTYYNIPYFDIGVRLVASSSGGEAKRIEEICGTVHYVRPGRSSLMSRGLFTMAQVAAAGLARTDPAAHQQQIKDGYITGVEGRRPAVIGINMFASSLAVSELLARLHPFREERNNEYAEVAFSLASMELIPDAETGICAMLSAHTGKGDVAPFLDQMIFADLA